MKRFTKIISGIMVVILCFGCSGKKTVDTSKTQYERDKIATEEQIAANKGSSTTKIGGTVAGGAGGAAGGAGAGAAIGAGIGSVVPVAGTATGAIIGAIVGGIAGGIGGSTAGYTLSNGDISEYINVTTNFVFTQHSSEAVQTMVYGASANEAKYFDPIFTVGEDASLVIEMNTALLKKASKASPKQRSEDLLIPVEVSISKSNNIEVTYDGGIKKEAMRIEPDIDGTARFSFYIKNNPELHPKLRLTFVPAEQGKAEVTVTYGLPEYKIVDSTCDVFQTIKFVQ